VGKKVFYAEAVRVSESTGSPQVRRTEERTPEKINYSEVGFFEFIAMVINCTDGAEITEDRCGSCSSREILWLTIWCRIV
jgi:hypothetical protein